MPVAKNPQQRIPWCCFWNVLNGIKTILLLQLKIYPKSDLKRNATPTAGWWQLQISQFSINLICIFHHNTGTRPYGLFPMFISPKVFPVTIPPCLESVLDLFSHRAGHKPVYKPVVVNSIIDPCEFQQEHSRTGLGPELAGRDSWYTAQIPIIRPSITVQVHRRANLLLN